MPSRACCKGPEESSPPRGFGSGLMAESSSSANETNPASPILYIYIQYVYVYVYSAITIPRDLVYKVMQVVYHSQ